MQMATEQSSLGILGVPLTRLDSYAHAVECLVERIHNRQKTFCVAINPEKIWRSQSDESLRQLINLADFHICDGVGAAIAARVLHGERVGRITGVQLFLDLIAAAETHSLKVFLLGASSESNAGACRGLQEDHPRLQIVGNQDGYFQDTDEMVARINATMADMLFVAMGSPRQERWIAENRERINAPLCMGVGGTFDVVSGKSRWAPAIFRRTGTEFLYRLVWEPTRWRRQVVLPLFALRVLVARASPAKEISAASLPPQDKAIPAPRKVA